MNDPSVRKQKSGDQLAPGDWLAPGELVDGAAEVLYALTYPAAADSSRDNDGKHVQLVVREQGEVATYADIASGSTLFDLASEEDLAPLREKTERAQAIADLRTVAGAMERSPWLPMPRLSTLVHLYGDEGMRTVLALADRYGRPVDRHLDDRTEVLVPIAGSVTLDVIAWHKDGRPAEPKPLVDPDASMEAHYDAEIDAHTPHPSWPSKAELKPWESLAPAAKRVAESMESADPTGLSYTRADVDETRPGSLIPAPIAEHYEATVPGDRAELCACGGSFSTREQLRRHIGAGNAKSAD